MNSHVKGSDSVNQVTQIKFLLTLFLKVSVHKEEFEASGSEICMSFSRLNYLNLILA